MARFRETEPEPLRGAGSFQWNSNGWTGSQFGSSAWLFVGALELLPKDRAIAAIWFACFAMINSVGKSLWNRRARVAPFHAFQGLLTVALVAGLFAWFFTVAFRPELLASIRTGRDTGALTLAILPCLMTWFWLMERSTIREKQSSGTIELKPRASGSGSSAPRNTQPDTLNAAEVSEADSGNSRVTRDGLQEHGSVQQDQHSGTT